MLPEDSSIPETKPMVVNGIDMRYMKKAMKQLKTALVKGKDIVPVIGRTRAGKSALIAYLLGCDIDIKTTITPTREILTHIIIKANGIKNTCKIPFVGDGPESVTLISKPFWSPESGMLLEDCPGFDGERPEIENVILENLSFQIAMTAANRQKAILVALPYKDLTPGGLLPALAKLLGRIAKNPETIAPTLLFVITKSELESERQGISNEDFILNVAQKVLAYQLLYEAKLRGKIKNTNFTNRLLQPTTQSNTTSWRDYLFWFKGKIWGSTHSNEEDPVEKEIRELNAACDIMCMINRYDIKLASVSKLDANVFSDVSHPILIKENNTIYLLGTVIVTDSESNLKRAEIKVTKLCEANTLPKNILNRFPPVGAPYVVVKTKDVPLGIYRLIISSQGHTILSPDNIPPYIVAPDIRDKESRKVIQEKVNEIYKNSGGVTADDFNFYTYSPERQQFEKAICQIADAAERTIKQSKKIPKEIEDFREEINGKIRLCQNNSRRSQQLREDLEGKHIKKDDKLKTLSEQQRELEDSLRIFDNQINNISSEIDENASELRTLDTSEKTLIYPAPEPYNDRAPFIYILIPPLLCPWRKKNINYTFDYPILEVEKHHSPRGEITENEVDLENGIYKTTYRPGWAEDGFYHVKFYTEKRHMPANEKRITGLKQSLETSRRRLSPLEARKKTTEEQLRKVKKDIKNIENGVVADKKETEKKLLESKQSTEQHNAEILKIKEEQGKLGAELETITKELQKKETRELYEVAAYFAPYITCGDSALIKAFLKTYRQFDPDAFAALQHEKESMKSDEAVLSWKERIGKEKRSSAAQHTSDGFTFLGQSHPPGMNGKMQIYTHNQEEILLELVLWLSQIDFESSSNFKTNLFGLSNYSPPPLRTR